MLNDVSTSSKCKVYEFYSKKSDGVCLYNDKGKKVIDLSSGNVFGHNNKIIEHAIIKALNQNILFHAKNVQNIEEHHLIQQLCKLAGFFEVKIGEQTDIYGDAILCNSSNEAIETAVNIAKNRYNILCNRDYNEILCMENYNFLEGKDKYSYKLLKNSDINSIEGSITEHTSAILLETIQFNNGLYEYDENFWKQLRKICDKHEILLILDETQCGCGRCESFFAYQQYNIKPDIVCLGNSIVGGLNYGACIFNAKYNKFYKRSLSSINNNTNIMYTKIAIDVIKTLSKGIFLQEVKRIKNDLNNEFLNIQDKFSSMIKRIVIKGVNCYIEFTNNINVEKLLDIMLSNGLLCKNLYNNAIILTFPIICTTAIIKKVKDIIEISFEEVNIIERY